MRRRRTGESSGRIGQDRWMVSYADFITLMFALFVVLFAAARMESDELVGVLHAVQAAFNGDDAPEATPPTQALPEAVPESVYETNQPSSRFPGESLSSLQDSIETLVAMSGLEGKLHTRLERRGLTVSLVEAGFFQTGNPEPRSEALPAIDALARILKATRYSIRIEGHTDDAPIRTERFPSNWELSTARATWMVVHLVREYGFTPSRLSAAGYGEFKPLASNATAEGRALNRRVDVVILSEEGSAMEPNVVASNS